MRADRRHWTATVLPRVLLVVALVLGLCAMHVVAAAIGRHHTTAHQNTAAHQNTGAGSPTAMDHAAPIATAAAAPDHHSATADCVLFLGAGVALLLVLVAWATARALRSSPWLPAPWFATSTVITPRRGPPAWHWPRISLCVFRV